LVCVDDGWQQSCGGGLDANFYATCQICHCFCQIQLLVMHTGLVSSIVAGLMYVACAPRGLFKKI